MNEKETEQKRDELRETAKKYAERANVYMLSVYGEKFPRKVSLSEQIAWWL